MKNEAVSVQVPTKVYLDLAFHLRKSGDQRNPDQVVAVAIRTWLSSCTGKTAGLGYQWKDLFLPDGTDLRMRYRGAWHYAAIKGDQLIYADESVSPRDWGLMVTGTVRNAWRDVWIRRSINDSWNRACALRSTQAGSAPAPDGERRRVTRRITD